jgi:ADP-ribose pyrophosphatase
MSCDKMISKTGIKGRGKLYYLGANQAADAVITKFNSNSNQFELLVIVRKDNGRYALPGGFIDAGEEATAAALRELKEETGFDLKNSIGIIIYKGIVNDHRNTDDAWIETTAVHHHILKSEELIIRAGDDAASVLWLPMNDDTLNNLHANHGEIARLALQSLIATKK